MSTPHVAAGPKLLGLRQPAVWGSGAAPCPKCGALEGARHASDCPWRDLTGRAAEDRKLAPR